MTKQERDFESEALAMGYKGEEDYKGDPDKFMDAEAFVKYHEASIPKMRSTIIDLNNQLQKRNAQLQKNDEQFISYKDQTDKLLANLRKQNEKAQEQAVEDGDVEKFRELKKEGEELKEPPRKIEQNGIDPAIQSAIDDFNKRNPVVTRSPMLQQEMVAILDNEVDQTKSVNDQFHEGEAILQKRWPHLFPANDKRDEVPSVSTGARTVRTKSKEKGYRDLPDEARRMADDMAARFKRMGREYSKEDYAKEYFRREENE